MASRREEQREVRMKTAQDLAEQTRGFEPTAIKLPEGVEWFQLKSVEAGEKGKSIEVDFMPYTVGKGNPDCDEGWGYYRRRFWLHRIPTPKSPKGTPLCCELTFGRKTCRICRWLQKVANEAMAKDCKAKGRYLWLVNTKPGTPPGDGNPWHIFETTDWLKGCFPGLLQDAINSTNDGQEFCDLMKGKTARLLVKKQDPNERIQNSYNDVTRIDLVSRKYTYPSKLLAAAPCLDDMLIDTPADQLDELLGDGEAEAPEKRTSGARSAKAKDSDVEPDSATEPAAVDSDVDSSTEPAAKDSDVDSAIDSDLEPAASNNGKPKTITKGDFVTYKKKEYEVLKVSSDGTSLTLEDQDGKQKHAAPSDCVKVPVADAGSDVEPEDSDVDSEPEDSGLEPAAAADSDVEPADSDVEDDPKKKPSSKKPAPKPAPKKRK